mmetsp:Transcript_56310/g.99891  ORF Transcript_56310/g.99891 Transcript_56310/m.99891 type:complete len:222 (+) Transcript_56310:517-1182(+)
MNFCLNPLRLSNLLILLGLGGLAYLHLLASPLLGKGHVASWPLSVGGSNLHHAVVQQVVFQILQRPAGREGPCCHGERSVTMGAQRQCFQLLRGWKEEGLGIQPSKQTAIFERQFGQPLALRQGVFPVCIAMYEKVARSNRAILPSNLVVRRVPKHIDLSWCLSIQDGSCSLKVSKLTQHPAHIHGRLLVRSVNEADLGDAHAFAAQTLQELEVEEQLTTS